MEKRDMTGFSGRTILVTGASGGIGGATVRHLVDAGADVIVDPIVFCLSDGASMISGVCLPVDGGYTSRQVARNEH
jgi:hypothetical protein